MALATRAPARDNVVSLKDWLSGKYRKPKLTKQERQEKWREEHVTYVLAHLYATIMKKRHP